MSERRLLIGILLIMAVLLVSGTALEITDGKSYLVVFGNSMQHGQEHQIGVLDSGDMASYEPFELENISSYYEGQGLDYQVAGDYGDVIIFRDCTMKYVHRALCWVQVNRTQENITMDIPELDIYGASQVELYNYGGFNRTINISADWLADVPADVNGGFITIGDNRVTIDQESGMPLVTQDVLVGKVTRIMDNELLFSSGYELVYFMVLAIAMVLSFSMRQYWNTEFIPRTTTILLLGSLGLKILASINGSSLLDSQEKFILYLSFGLIAVLVIIMSWGTIWLKSRFSIKQEHFVPIMLIGLIPVLLIPYMVWPLAFAYPFVCFIIIAALFWLQQDMAFNEDNESKLGNWMLLTGLGILFLLIMLIITVPLFLMLVASWFVVTVYCIGRLRKTGYSEPQS